MATLRVPRRDQIRGISARSRFGNRRQAGDASPTSQSIQEKLVAVKSLLQKETRDVAHITQQIGVLRKALSMKEHDDKGTSINAKNFVNKEEEKEVYLFYGFAFKKNGSINNSKIDSIADKCRRKGTRGWIKKTPLGILGEVWGMGDRGPNELNWKQTRKWLDVQEECVISDISGSKQEREVEAKFAINPKRTK